MKKFNLIETMKAHGFEYSDNAFGCPVFTLELSRRTEVAWYGVQEFKMSAQVVFNPERTSCTVNYFDGSRRPFKSKTHLADKRAWNAICETFRNNGYEVKEVA